MRTVCTPSGTAVSILLPTLSVPFLLPLGLPSSSLIFVAQISALWHLSIALVICFCVHGKLQILEVIV